MKDKKKLFSVDPPVKMGATLYVQRHSVAILYLKDYLQTYPFRDVLYFRFYLVIKALT